MNIFLENFPQRSTIAGSVVPISGSGIPRLASALHRQSHGFCASGSRSRLAVAVIAPLVLLYGVFCAGINLKKRQFSDPRSTDSHIGSHMGDEAPCKNPCQNDLVETPCQTPCQTDLMEPGALKMANMVEFVRHQFL